MQETWVPSLGREAPLEKEMATHSRILAWRIPWTEEPGGIQSMGSQRVSQRTRLKRLSTYAASSCGVQGTCLPCRSTCYHSVGAGVGCPASRARSNVHSFWLCPRPGFSTSCQLTEFISPGSLPAVWLGSTAGCRIPSHPPLLQRRSGPFILFSEARFCLRGAGGGHLSLLRCLFLSSSSHLDWDLVRWSFTSSQVSALQSSLRPQIGQKTAPTLPPPPKSLTCASVTRW